MELRVVELRPGHAVAPTAHAALAHGYLPRVLANCRKHILVSRGEIVLGQEEVGVAPVPRGHSTAWVELELEARGGEFADVVSDQRQVFLLARGQERESVDLAVNATFHVGGDVAASHLENPPRLRAVPGRRRAIGPEDREPEAKAPGVAPAPDQQVEAAGRFGTADRPRECLSRVGIERLPIEADDHVADLQDPVGRAVLVHLGDENLSGVGRLEAPPPDPAPRARWAEVPVVFVIGFAPAGQVRHRGLPPPRGNGAKQEEQSNHAEATQHTRNSLLEAKQRGPRR